MSRFCTLNAKSGFQEHGISISDGNIKKQREPKTISIKEPAASKNTEPKRQKAVKNGYLYAPFSEGHFLDSKSHSLHAAHEQKTFFAEK